MAALVALAGAAFLGDFSALAAAGFFVFASVAIVAGLVWFVGGPCDGTTLHIYSDFFWLRGLCEKL